MATTRRSTTRKVGNDRITRTEHASGRVTETRSSRFAGKTTSRTTVVRETPKKSKPSAGDSLGGIIIGAIVLALVAIFYALLGVSFALTSPGALLSAAWMKFNNMNLPAATIWMTGVVTGLAIIAILWVKIRDISVALILYAVIAVISVIAEYFIGIRAFAFGESEPPYQRTWLSPVPGMPASASAIPPPPMATPAVTAPPPQVVFEPPKQEPLVWRDASPTDNSSATRQEPVPVNPEPVVAVPPAPTFVREQYDR